MPFCQVSRLTTQKQRAVVVLEAEALLDRARGWRARRFSVLRRSSWRRARVGRRVPDVGVDAVDDAVQIGRARADQAVEAHAEFRRADLLRIGRADRGDRVGACSPALRKPTPP